MSTLLRAPSTNFNGVRDGRLSLPLWFDIDLTNLRDDTASNPALIVQVAGNVMYFDANPNDGNAVVEFQDTSYDRASTPFYASPGAIYRVPFTQIKVTNPAQAGKKIRVIYGVDVDFTPGALTQIAFAGSVALDTQTELDLRTPLSPTGWYSNNASTVANTPLTVFTAAANVNGCVILNAHISSTNPSNTAESSFVAKATAPTSVVDGDIILGAIPTYLTSTQYGFGSVLAIPQYIAPGLGLYFISGGATGGGYSTRSVRYRML